MLSPYAIADSPQNHSCAPNCWMKNVVINEYTKKKCVLALFTLEAVEEDQELHFSYFGSLDDVRISIQSFLEV